jgi:hypothetical protein
VTRFDVIKICTYIFGFCTLATGDTIGAILAPFGASPSLIAQVAKIIGALAVLAALILNTLKNPSPPAGQVSVTAPATATQPITPEELTTATAPKVGT